MKKSENMSILIDKLLAQYYNLFHDVVPLRWMNLSDQETVDLLIDCIRTKKPFDSKKYFPADAIL